MTETRDGLIAVRTRYCVAKLIKGRDVIRLRYAPTQPIARCVTTNVTATQPDEINGSVTQ